LFKLTPVTCDNKNKLKYLNSIMLAEARDMTDIHDSRCSNFDKNRIKYKKIERYGVECFGEIVDNFVDKSLRALDIARKERSNVMLGNQGSIAGEIHISYKINWFRRMWITRRWYMKISENRL